LKDGEDVGAFADPGFEFVDAFAGELAAIGIVNGFYGLGELVEFAFPAVEMGADLFLDEAAGEAFEFGCREIVGAAVAVGIGLADGTEGFEGAEALAGGAFADGEAAYEVVEGKGAFGNEEEAVNFADGLRETEHAHAIGEEIDDLLFEGIDRYAGCRFVTLAHGCEHRGIAVLFNLF
jgi:hypothetical protein